MKILYFCRFKGECNFKLVNKDTVVCSLGMKGFTCNQQSRGYRAEGKKIETVKVCRLCGLVYRVEVRTCRRCGRVLGARYVVVGG